MGPNIMLNSLSPRQLREVYPCKRLLEQQYAVGIDFVGHSG